MRDFWKKDEKKWMVSKVKRQQETRVMANLQAQDIEAFWPHRVVTVRHARRLSERPQSLFPGYIFVKSGPQQITQLNSTRGIQYILRYEDGRPNVIPSDIMEALFQRFNPNGLVKKDKTISKGDSVRVANGPFAGCLGEVENAPENDRIFVLLSFSDAHFRCSINANNIEKVRRI